MQLERPYFMTNEEWYHYDVKTRKLTLTDKAPPEAIKSYEETYKILKSQYKDDLSYKTPLPFRKVKKS